MPIDIDKLTIGEARKIAAMFGSAGGGLKQQAGALDGFAVGQSVIVRTYSAGVWCGTLRQKAENEVVLTDARRMWRWWCAKSISLSGVVAFGIRREKSKIAAPVPEVWLEAIEILPISGGPLASIMEAEIVEAE